MERSLSSLTYKGSIPEAINEAKKQKKLFVVYISGEDTESTNLENTTWTDLKVAESVSKYCILLHVQEGTSDAANFRAIYPQNSNPCITAIGYNGIQVWKTGFVSAELLASSLEKAWLSLHIQETTATVLTAALASNKSEPPTSGTSVIGSSEQGSSSGTTVPPPSLEKNIQASEARSLATSVMTKENNTELGVKTSSKSFSSSPSGGVGDNHSTSSSKEAENSLTPAEADPDNSQAEQMALTAPSPAGTSDTVSTAVIPVEVNEVVENERVDDTDGGKVDALGSSGRASESTDVHLNIRLPDGVSLREKFSVTSTLGILKDYVDRNQTGISSYDLAIPYPRKIFTDEELSLFNRQALIVVPRQKASGYHGGGSSSSGQTSSRTNADPSNESEGGYFAYVRRLLSYVNPLSYLGRGGNSSNSGQDSQTGIWEYGPNPTLRNNLSAGARLSSASSPNQGTSSSRNESKNRLASTSRFGSNIHTLKHDEDDSRFSDRNAFWNGNSTQYGGDNNGR
ncbi:plant UBX domain-containing protein 11 [Melia azedarach]|uniref:Plant UBX domain-containing protein 11 n=1 Tax=Melia azedarach TaxID=155640 RepID=A0ACC1YHA3_MELAZ|nr:plant UBX domain-containing protein 11 [Melia azedarach]